MAEVSTAPIAKSAPKAAAKSSKPKTSVQTKPELTGGHDKLIQPFRINTNQAVHRNSAALSGLWRNSVQTKLTVGKPGDKYEKEADAVADKVVSGQAPVISKNQEEITRPKQALQRSERAEEEQPAIQESREALQAQPEEADLQKLPEEHSEINKIQASPHVASEVQAKNGDGAVSSGFESKLSEARSGGSALPQSTISKVEPHVGADLSSVRVHTDSKAVALNQSLGSQAFANQNHIFFNEGKYNPGTTSGDHLIAHEATHTVQQGASVRKKTVEDEAPEELQMKEDKPATDNQQAAAPPATPPPPSDATPNAGSGNAAGNSGSPGDQHNQDNTNSSAPGTGANNHPVSPPPDASGNKAPLQPNQDLQRENPITQRAADYKEEEVAQVKALNMEGNSEQAMASFTGAGASQVAMAFPTMGDTLNQKLDSEKQKAAKDAPKLTAGTTGVKDQKTKKAADPGAGKSADLKDGITEAEPAAQQLEPHQEGTPLPSNRPDTRLDEGKPAKEESGGFFSWLFDKFRNIMGAVKTMDHGLNTKAGAAPKIDTKGKANPNRTENQSREGKDQVNREKQAAAREIHNNPGQQNVQPLFFEEPKEVIIDTTVQNTTATSEDQAMTDFVSLPLPESVRTQTDLDLAPKMEKSLAKPRQDTQLAAQKRNTDKQAAIKQKQAEAEKMNQAAEKEQKDLVTKNREAIAAEQKRGVDEAETQMNAFSTEADKEKAKANKAVKERIKKDQSDGEKKLKAAEGEAATKKKEGEAEAKAEKEAAKKNSKKKSWWGRFKDAVSSAVSWVTEQISKIFDKIRKAVKFIIDKAKKAALALIEAGRKWIIDKLDKFGNWLKEKANKYLKHFPALRKRVNAFIDKTVDGAKKLVNKVADGLKKGVEALADALGKAINAVLNAFEGALKAAVQIAGAMLKGDFAEALKIAFMATCKVAGIDPTPILNFINKAGETIGLIFKNPAAFFSNVAGGVRLGIDQFVKNIKKHLISGLITWLTGAMSDVPIQMPQKFDLKGIFSLVMQILGLTYDRIRAKVVKRIGPKGEQIVSGMEKTFQFVKDLVTKGPIVLWERIRDKFNEIKEMAIDKIRNLVTIEVVKAGIKWIIGLLNPASAIVKAVLMLYDFVMFLIERKDQIIGFVTAVFDTVGPLARGQIKKAGNAVEGAMGRGVPVILGLLANLAGLGGIGKSVSKVIKTIQKPVDKVVDPVIGWLVKQGKKLWKKGKAGAKKLKDKVFNLLGLKKGFKTKDGKNHTLKFQKKGDSYELVRASVPTYITEYISKKRTAVSALDDSHPDKAGYLKILGQVDKIYKDDLKQHIVRKAKDGSEKDKYFGQKDGANVRKYIGKIARKLAEIPDNLNDPDSKNIMPDSKIKYGDLFKNSWSFTNEDGKTVTKSSEDGKSVKADPLTMISKREAGSAASHYSTLYKHLIDYEFGVIAGHLLNHQTFGSGKKDKNLSPIPSATNTQMEGEIEHHLKQAVLKDGKVVSYSVTIVYNRTPDTDSGLSPDIKLPGTIETKLYQKKLKPEEESKTGAEKDKAKRTAVNWVDGTLIKEWDDTIPMPSIKAGANAADIVKRIIDLMDGDLKKEPTLTWSKFAGNKNFTTGKLGRKIKGFDNVKKEVQRQYYAKQMVLLTQKHKAYSSKIEGFIIKIPDFKNAVVAELGGTPGTLKGDKLKAVILSVFRVKASGPSKMVGISAFQNFKLSISQLYASEDIRVGNKVTPADIQVVENRYEQFKGWFNEAKEGKDGTGEDGQVTKFYLDKIETERRKISSKKEKEIEPALNKIEREVKAETGLTTPSRNSILTHINKLKSRLNPEEGRIQKWTNAIYEFKLKNPDNDKVTWDQFYAANTSFYGDLNSRETDSLRNIFPYTPPSASTPATPVSTKLNSGQSPPQGLRVVASTIERQRGLGKPLPSQVQRNLGEQMKSDLSQVRIHTGVTSSSMNRKLNSQAFTSKDDIFFDTGKYEPNSKKGKHLLTHELAHTKQHKEKIDIYKHQSSNNPALQPKLTIGQPNDKYEQEADRVADQVVRASSVQPGVQKKCVGCEQEEKVSKKPLIQRMDKEEEQNQIQLMSEEELQTQRATQTAEVAPTGVQSSIQQSRGSGSPLPTSTRSFMESQIGADFSKVRVHTDSTAHKLNAKLNAQAFATGNDIYFNKGKFNPETQSGKHLLAHELTHTLQQRASPPRIQRNVVRNPVTRTPEGYEFEIGVDLSLQFVTLAKKLSKDGSLSTNDLMQLRAYMLRHVGTVTEYARLFMAGMLHAPNLAIFNGIALSKGKKFTFPLSTITQARRARITDLNRDVDLTDINKHSADAAAALGSFDFQEFSKHIGLRDNAVKSKIVSLAGTRYHAHIKSVITYAENNRVDLQDLLAAMIAGASDSSEGDRLSAAVAYAIAAASGHALTGQLLSGTIKVDALVPAAFASMFGAQVMAGYGALAGGVKGIKGDTLYLKTDIDINNLAHRSNVIHELNHAVTDNTANPATAPVQRLARTLEYDAFMAQALYILDQIHGASPADRPQLVNQVVADWHAVVGICFFIQTQLNLRRYRPVLQLLTAAAPAPFTANAARVNVLLGRPAATYINAAQGTIDTLYGFTPPSPGVTGTQVPVDGFAGESILDYIFR